MIGVAVAVGVTVTIGVAVFVGVTLTVAVGVAVTVGVAVALGDAVAIGDTVTVGETLGVEVTGGAPMLWGVQAATAMLPAAAATARPASRRARRPSVRSSIHMIIPSLAQSIGPDGLVAAVTMPTRPGGFVGGLGGSSGGQVTAGSGLVGGCWWLAAGRAGSRAFTPKPGYRWC
jgi:hypothetical protein